MEVIARMTLAYKGKHDAPLPGKFDAYLGRGEGTVRGGRIRGEVVWDLYENQSPAACDANFVGTIRTEDGAAIGFEVLGFFKRRAGTAFWDLSSAIRFETSDVRYGCFDNCVGIVSGHFDMESYTHDYRISAPGCSA